MKSLLRIFAFALLLSGLDLNVASAQVPNGGFESWGILPPVPTGWVSDFITGSTSKSSDKHSGNSAVAGSVIADSDTTTVSPGLATGKVDIASFTITPGFPTQERPTSVKGFYKFTSAENDNFSVTVFIQKAGLYIGIGYFVDSTSHTGYQEFVAPIDYLTEETPDTAIIAIAVGAGGGNEFAHLGTSFVVDDVSFSNEPLAVKGSMQVSELELKQNYPNPFNPTTTIEYVMPKGGEMTLDLFDINGRFIRSLASGMQTAGSHRIRFDADGLPSGVYQYVLKTGTSRVSRMLQLVK